MNDYNEQEVARIEKEVYGGSMPVANKTVLRDMLKKEDKVWERYEGREEVGHSHSVVGDEFNRE